MFGRNRQRHTNIVFVIFRLILSVVMFAVLLGGIYSAYKHFSGFDPLKLDPKVLVSRLINARSLNDVVAMVSSKSTNTNDNILGQITPGNTSKNIFKFLLVADSHNDNTYLATAINQAKIAHPDLAFIIGLGDYTEVGTLDELEHAKKIFDQANLRYFLVPGDHDFWESREKSASANTNFQQIFGPTFQAFTFENYLILLLDNSDNYLGIGDEQTKWIENQLERVNSEGIKDILVFVHEPLFHPSSDRVMGKVEPQLKQQAQALIFQLKTARVKKIFAADIHYFSEYSEPVTSLDMVTIGAITRDRNPQASRYGIGYVFEDGTVKVEDVEVR